MPLIKSGSKAARQKNIEEMVHSGHDIKQSVAAAYANQRKYSHKGEKEMKAHHKAVHHHMKKAEHHHKMAAKHHDHARKAMAKAVPAAKRQVAKHAGKKAK